MTDRIAYQRKTLNLTAAGRDVIEGPIGYFHILEFNDGAGAIELDGLLRVSYSLANQPSLPCRYNFKSALPQTVPHVVIEWDAQPGIYAEILTSPRPDYLVADSPSPKQIVVPSSGAGYTTEPIAVGDTEELLAAADALRQCVTLYNAGPDTVEIIATGGAFGDGIPVPSGAYATVRANVGAVYGICDTGDTADVRVMIEA